MLLSDEIDLPFQDFLSWETFSVKWPMRDLEKLYEHLRALSKDAKLDALHRQVRQVACWFDYLQPTLRWPSESRPVDIVLISSYIINSICF